MKLYTKHPSQHQNFLINNGETPIKVTPLKWLRVFTYLIVLPFRFLLRVLTLSSLLLPYKFRRKLNSTQRLFLNVIIASIFLIFGIWIYTSFSQPEQSEAAWFNDQWLYRQKVDITNSSGSNLTDFQVAITLNTAQMITDGKLQADCDDIRITDAKGRLLPHWIEGGSPGCNSTGTEIWVKVPILTTNGTTLYIYYGNPSAMNNEKPKNVFLFFDNFPIIATEQWKDTTGGTNSIIGTGYDSKALSTTDDENDIRFYTTASFSATTGYALKARIREDGIDGGLFFDVQNDANGYLITSRRDGGTSAFQWYKRVSGEWISISFHNTISSWTSTEFRTLEIKRISTGITVKDNETTISYDTSADATYPGGAVGIRGAIHRPQTIDWILVRKAVATEPTISLGTEEQSPGPVGYWSMDEGTGSTVYDKTTRGNNGTISGATWKPKSECKVGSCLYFDGIDDSVSFGNISNTATVAGNLTISFWMKPTNIAKGIQNPLGKAYGGEFDFTLETNGSLSGYHGSAGTNAYPYTQINTTASIQNNQWTHVVYTRDVTTRTLKYYINGRLDKTQTYSSTFDPQPSTRSFKFGYEYAGYYQGYLDEVIIFPVVKSEQEIKALYAAGNAGTTAIKGASTSIGSYNKSSLNQGLVGYWKMDETTWSGTAGEVIDSSGNENNGTAVSGAEASPSAKFGRSGYFAGIDENVAINNSPSISNFSNGVTVSLWFKTNSVSTAQSQFGYNGGGFLNFWMNSGVSSTNLRWETNAGQAITSTTAIYPNTWYHAVGVYDTKTGIASLYINGRIDVSANLTFNTSKSGIVTIGSYSTSQYFFNGNIDEVRIYNRALSPAEAQELYNFAPGPVAYYDFEEGQGTSLKDKSGNNVTATLGGDGLGTDIPLWTSGKFGKALYFDGSNDYVSISNPSIDDFGKGEMTATAWIKTSSTSFAEIIDNKGAGSNASGFNLQLEGGTGKPYFRIANGTTQNNTGAGPTNVAADGKWHHIAGVLERGSTNDRLLLYVDGILVRSVNNSPGWNITSAQTLFIGAYGASPGDGNFSGIIDEVRIYNYARTQKQIIEDMNAGHPIGGSPVGSQALYLKFDEGYGTTAYDSGPNKINGTISNATWTNDGKFGKAISFNGSTSQIAFNNSALHITGDLTLSAWIFVRTWATGKPIVRHAPNAFSDYSWEINNSGGMTFGWYDGAWQGVTSDGPAMNTSTWYHVAVTRQNNIITFYVNGKQYGNTKNVTTPTATATTLGIGYKDASNHIDAILDEVKVYASALTADQIRIDMNRNASLVMGATSTSDDGTTASSSASRAYCIPGDTGTCNPPVGEWRFEEGSGGTVNDTSGNGNTGTWNGTGTLHWTKGKIGKAGNFDGSSDYVSVNSSATIPTGGTARTLEMWVYTTDNSWADNANTIFEYGTNTTRQAFGIDMNPFPNIEVYTWADDATVNTGLSNKTGWWHLAVTYDGSTTIKTYINGMLKSTKTLAGVLNTASSTVNIGRSALVNAYFDGRLDHIQIYDYARTPAQIAWDYNRGKPVAHWKFDECQGSAVNDSSGNGNSGTINIGATGSQTSVGTCSTSSTAWGNGATGKFNHSLNFDGTDDYISTNYTHNFTNGFSASAWFKTTSSTTNLQTILANGGADSGTIGISLRVTAAGQILFEGSKGTSGTWNFSTTSNKIVNDGIWHFITATWDGTTNTNAVKLYIDGILDRQITALASVGNSSITLNIGRIPGGGVSYFDGKIDDVQIFNYALTANQVKSLYNQGSAIRFGPTSGTP